MMKRLLCMLCCLALLFGIVFTAAPASAAEVVASGSSDKIYFSVYGIKLRSYEYEYIDCYMWDIFDKNNPIEWGSNKGRCTYEGNGKWSYDFGDHGITITEGGFYYVIFTADWSFVHQTYPLLFDASCFGDTACITVNMIENPVDSTKMTYETKWTYSDERQFGPMLMISSTGNVTGSAIPYCTDANTMFYKFLRDDLDNVRMNSGKDDQTLLDDIAQGLDLGVDDVEKEIAAAGVSTDWDRNKSSLLEGPGMQPGTPKPQYLLGDVDGDTVISVIDATKIQKLKAKIISESDINMDAADVDGDGYVTVMDAGRIQKYKAKILNLDGSTPYKG